CGFKYHHIIKDQYVEYLDEIRTEVICRLTKSEWQKQQ
ncbi:RimJ/RimL family protein N-acetyltransferase, partial [Proteus mirabilis]